MLIVNDSTEQWDVELDHWSNSQDSDFRQCKRKWWLSRAHRLEPKAVKEPLYRGTAVHHALEMFHSLELADRSLDVLQHYFNASYNEATADVPGDKRKEVEDWRNLIGRKTMEGIWNKYGVDKDVPPTTMTEFADEVMFPGAPAPYQFRLDGLIFDEKNVIFETKTSGSKYESDWIKFITYDLQGPRNLWALNRALGTEIETVKYNFISYPGKRSKKIILLRYDVEINQEQQLASVYDIPHVMKEATRPDLVIYPTLTASCSYMCDFSRICLLKKYGRTTDNIIQEDFRQKDETAVTLRRKA